MRRQIKEEETKQRENIVVQAENERQTVGFLNRYDFAYAGRDTVNQVSKVAPGVTKAVTNGINNITQDRINQIISQGGKEVERVLPEILRGKHH